jgi:small-conductance mechanosensitive channel
MVRIPNESVLKANVTNLTHFAIRRYDLLIGVSYREDLARVRKILLEVAEANPLCLKEPGPLILFKGFADSAVTLQFSVWSQQEKFLELRNGIGEGVKRAFDAHGVELPFPHHTVHVGADTRPLPVQLLGDGPT